ncbi:uncharacterized protein [Medicago truncatula]|uniref:uncharacterized protein isoform X1 n=1 Tax=Medicago truncatula TaxID=3880 RepID=UPI000D2F468A|nr:uncharacterized protein LOC25487159 isoform X1 [Medicago truncatula]
MGDIKSYHLCLDPSLLFRSHSLSLATHRPRTTSHHLQSTARAPTAAPPNSRSTPPLGDSVANRAEEMQEENVDQSSCTLSLSSTLTQCTSLGTDTVQHKKRTRDSDCESDCDSRFYSPTNMRQQNEEQLFNELFKVRRGHPTYGKYRNWCDIALWEEIVKELRKHDPRNNPTISDLLTVVIKYYKEYKDDPDLLQRSSQSFRMNIRQVFDPIPDIYGCLTYDVIERVHCIVRPQSSLSGEAIEYQNNVHALEFFKNKAGRILPSTSDRGGIREYKKERGYGGLLALQYGEDLTALEIDDETKVWFLTHFNSDSAEYESMANFPRESRLNCLVKLLQQYLTQTESSSHQSSSAKSSRRRKEPRINS